MLYTFVPDNFVGVIMSEAYAREILRRNVAQICQTMGWNGINSQPLDILVHVLEKYIKSLATQANRHAEQFNRTEPNLHDLALVFRDLHIQLPELADYVHSVPPAPPPVSEKFPKPKETNLNFLKPGSHEVVTRPMHVHEHLPPMYPEKERDTPAVAGTVEIQQNGIDNGERTASCPSPEISVTDSPEKPKDIFKRPTDPVSAPNSKRPRLRLEEEERTREISSVMMTMSGFLSPAREGKLPEARPPTMVSDKHYDKHKANSNSGIMKPPMLDKSDKKSKKNKLLNGKVMKSKRRDKSHKGESSKSKDSTKLNKYPPGYPMKSKDIHPMHYNHVTMPAPRPLLPPSPSPSPSPSSMSISPSPSLSSSSARPVIAPPVPVPVPLPIPEIIKPVIKQEPIDTPSPVIKPVVPREDAIPVPRKIPISKSPLVTPSPIHKVMSAANSFIPDVQIKKEAVEEDVKLASQPDRSKINIFKRISNKIKDDKTTPEVVPEKSHSHLISRLQNSHANESWTHDNVKIKTEDPVVNNNDNSAVDMSNVIDLRTNEVISVDDDSLDMTPLPPTRNLLSEPRPSLSIKQSLQVPFPKDIASVSPKPKKEKKHKEKKDKLAKHEAKLLKRQQQQLAMEIAQAEKQSMRMNAVKPPKSNRPKNNRMPQMPPGFPFFSQMPAGRNMMPGPGLIPNPGLIPGSDFLAGLANNPALRGLPSSNLLTNPFALGAGGPGLIPSGFLPGGLNPGIRNTLMPMGNFPHTSRSSMKIPPMLRRPSLEVIPVDNDDDRGMNKSTSRDKDRIDKHKAQTIPNILQKNKKSQKDHKVSIYKMPPIHPDITIELNPPKEPVRLEPVKQEPRRISPVPPRLPTPQPPALESKPEVEPLPAHVRAATPEPSELETENSEKKKDKHKKEKKDKDGLKIKKKKDKKDKNKEKDKAEKVRDKEDRKELKDIEKRIKKEKKEKKKEKSVDGVVPKLTLKFNSNSNSPMPPSSPDVFKLTIKPVVKKEEESPVKDPVSREHSRSPELAQISALVTRPPKQKHSKHNHVAEEPVSSPPQSGSSPTRKKRPPSGHSKFKRLLIKPMSKKGQADDLDDEVVSSGDEQAPMPVPSPAPASLPTDKPAGPLAAPFYVDAHGNKIWVCPACGRPDNGSPMIGCDGCDGWYHWVCVGITEEPGAEEDWFCKSCIAKRAAMALAGVTSSKKRGRKPKGEKNRDCH